jgi:2-polyprenyl-3-methyl-5-hydroxy-6-metoxy-1,4-benzoquinol methylase
MNPILSPIDKKSETILITEIPVDKIISDYKKIGYDVRRFFKDVTSVDIRQCTNTGYRFYYPFTIFGDEQFYIDIQNHADAYYPEGKWEHNLAYSLIESNSEVLEVGCATGHFMQALQQKHCRVTGLELNTNALKTARQNGLNVFNEMLHTHAEKNKLKYDVVCSFQVLEHIADVNDYFESALACLKPGGKLIIGVPNSNPYLYKYDIYHSFNLPPHHAGLWNKETFLNTARYFNLVPLDIKIERLKEYKIWYQMLVQHLIEKNKSVGKILSMVPRPVYKLATRILSPWIEGRNILVALQKNETV